MRERYLLVPPRAWSQKIPHFVMDPAEAFGGFNTLESAHRTCALFDSSNGFSIGSNDLTQLTLGLDRDSAIVAHLFDERNAAVMRLVRDVIQRAQVCGLKVGICGQAPSDYPEFARFLVTCGIDSISLNPDTVIKTTQDIVELEQQLVKQREAAA